MPEDILTILGITSGELTEIVKENPSLRGFISGYISEYKLRKFFSEDKRISNVRKYDDHDRTRKSDIVFTYKGCDISVEVKSLQTSTIRKDGDTYVGKTQCDASDKRPVKFPNGKILSTTCLLIGEFDLLAVNLFTFENKWNFIFSKNSNLPRSKYRKYTPAQRKYLISSLIEVSWPPKLPFTKDVFTLLDEIVKEKMTHREPIKVKEGEATDLLEIQGNKNDSS